LRHFRASDGARIAYRDDGDGRPLVLLHGLMAHSGFFAGQQPLAGDFRLIGVDLRGHGASADAGGALTVEQLAQDVSELAEALDLDEAIGIGWSLGASVLWNVLSGPSGRRFAASVVVDMTARVENVDGWDLGLSPDACALRSAAIAADFDTFATAAGQAIFSQPISAAMRETADWASREFARNDGATIGAVWQSLVGEDFRPLLPRISQPTLIVHGRHSQLYDAATAQYLARALPNASDIEFAGSGHAPQIEQSELFNKVIRDFADRPTRTPRPNARSKTQTQTQTHEI
jgi:pimeloyl-[acyl-carrier protein] methyl ester esterase